MFKATKEIAAYLKEKGIKYTAEENEKVSYVDVKYSGNNVPTIAVTFFSSDDDNAVAVRVLDLVRVPENKTAAVLKVIEELNSRFRYAKFVLDSKNQVRMDYDFALCTANLGEVAHEFCGRMVDIADKAYPELMKAIWS